MSAPETRSVFEATQDQVLMVGLREVTDPQAKGIGLQTEPSAASRGAYELQISAEREVPVYWCSLLVIRCEK